MPMNKQRTNEEYVLKRKGRAKRRYLRLISGEFEDGDFIVQKYVSGEWAPGHIITTDGQDAVDCTCPDRQKRGKDLKRPCYHMLAWEDWTFDEVMFEDEVVNQVTERERP